MQRISIYFATWSVTVLAVVFGLGNFYRPLYVRLVDHGVAVHGTVRGIRPKPHNLVDYEYLAGGQTFCGCQYPFWPNPAPDELRVGQSVALTYNSQRPAESLLGDPHSKLQNENITIALAALLIPISLAKFAGRTFDRITART